MKKKEKEEEGGEGKREKEEEGEKVMTIYERINGKLHHTVEKASNSVF